MIAIVHGKLLTVTQGVVEDGTLLIRIRLTAKKLPEVKPEGVPDSGFDVTVDEWGDPEEEELPV